MTTRSTRSIRSTSASLATSLAASLAAGQHLDFPYYDVHPDRTMARRPPGQTASEATVISYERFRTYIEEHGPNTTRNTFNLDLTDRQRRHWCPDHSWVIPHGGILCPYCMPVEPNANPRPRVVVIDRATGMVVLNPS